MFEIFINIFIIIGAIICVTGACFLAVFGYMILYELLIEQWDSFKLKLVKRNFDYEKKTYIINQLEDLKKRYPDLKIDYEIKK